MDISYDPSKRENTLKHRELDFEDAPRLFDGFTLSWQDNRREYGEDREITTGLIGPTVIVMVWTERETSRRIISMRKADRNEREYYFREMERSG